MSASERDRLAAIEAVKEKRLKQSKAAERQGVSMRHESDALLHVYQAALACSLHD